MIGVSSNNTLSQRRFHSRFAQSYDSITSIIYQRSFAFAVTWSRSLRDHGTANGCNIELRSSVRTELTPYVGFCETQCCVRFETSPPPSRAISFLKPLYTTSNLPKNFPFHVRPTSIILIFQSLQRFQKRLHHPQPLYSHTLISRQTSK